MAVYAACFGGARGSRLVHRKYDEGSNLAKGEPVLLLRRHDPIVADARARAPMGQLTVELDARLLLRSYELFERDVAR
jgi:hypothetical protein